MILTATSIIFLFLSNFSFFKFDQQIQDSNWIDLTTIQIDDYIQKYDILFVDITADWCATCQFNKINVLQSNKINKLFLEYNVL